MELESLASYKSWADTLIYDCVSCLPENELKQERAMLFGNILSLLHHVYAMDVVWKSHIKGEPHHFITRNPEVSLSFIELSRRQHEINTWYESYYTNLHKEKYSERVGFNYIGGGAGAMSKEQILHHVINHATYHRGHIEGVLYQLSIEPPTTDIPVFLDSLKTQ